MSSEIQQVSVETPISSKNYRILVVDDDLNQAEMVQEFLRISGFPEIGHVADIRSLWEHLKDHSYDIVLLDYKLPDGTGLDVLQQMGQRNIRLPVVMVTGQGTERIAVQAIQHGAADYLLKSGDYLLTLPALIRKTIRSHELALSVQRSLEQIRYQATLLNNVRDAIVVWDTWGKITFWNPAATALFGWKADERLGRSVQQVYLSTFVPPIVPPREGDLSGQHVMRQFTDRDGRVIWVSSRVASLREHEDHGRLLGYMDVSYDITRSVEAEQALRESEARYRAIVEDYQTEMICRFQPNGVLTYVNEVYCHYFGKSRDELVGMNFLYFVPDSERYRLVQHLVAFDAQRTVAMLEHQVDLPGQGLRWIQRTDRAIIDSHGHIFEFQSMERDITDRKRLEAQVQAAQAHLIQAARMATIGEMASGVAHQIYNPLTTIIADAQILSRSLPADHPERESAEAIQQAGWRLQQVVQRLMEFSRPSTEPLTRVSVNETLQSALSLVSEQIEAAGCKLDIQLASLLPAIQGNQRQIESLWLNLLFLARDAVVNGNGHVIRVRSAALPLPASRLRKLRQEVPPGVASAGVVVEIHDDGQPIPAEQLAAIFEPNFVGPSSGRGTGMELSICREIVRQHGGQIVAESKPGSPSITVFRVILPV